MTSPRRETRRVDFALLEGAIRSADLRRRGPRPFIAIGPEMPRMSKHKRGMGLGLGAAAPFPNSDGGLYTFREDKKARGNRTVASSEWPVARN
jgi:hypothetical protein